MYKMLLLLLTWICSLHAQTPVVILGGGISGMTAALQISQSGMTPLVIMGPKPGGIITVSAGVENWPGEFLIKGAHLADKLEEQVKKRGVKLMTAVVTSVDFSQRPFTIHVENPYIPGDVSTIQAECCIVALGAEPHLLGVEGEASLLYKKIFTCAPCDGLRFKDQEVAVIGGGESALVEAQYLANIAKKVTVIMRGKQFKTIQASRTCQLLSHPKITVLSETTVQSFQDNSHGIQIQLSTGKKLLVQAVFLAIGSRPNTDILKNCLGMDADGYIILEKGQATSIPGVFAAGDVSDKKYKQAITAAGDATKAALEAIHYLSTPSSGPETFQQISQLPQEVSDPAHLKSMILNSPKPVVVYFSAPTCMPCRAFKPLYQRWSEEYKEAALFLKIDTDKCFSCAEAYQIQSIPTVLIFNSEGKVICRATGSFQMSEIIKFLEKQKKGS